MPKRQIPIKIFRFRDGAINEGKRSIDPSEIIFKVEDITQNIDKKINPFIRKIMAIKIERTLTGFYIEDKGVLAEGLIFISEEDEGILYNQLEHLYNALLSLYKTFFHRSLTNFLGPNITTTSTVVINKNPP